MCQLANTKDKCYELSEKGYTGSSESCLSFCHSSIITVNAYVAI